MKVLIYVLIIVVLLSCIFVGVKYIANSSIVSTAKGAYEKVSDAFDTISDYFGDSADSNATADNTDDDTQEGTAE